MTDLSSSGGLLSTTTAFMVCKPAPGNPAINIFVGSSSLVNAKHYHQINMFNITS
jgi:hypothetical protein